MPKWMLRLDSGGKECRSDVKLSDSLLKEGRQVVDAERQRLGLSLLPTDLPFSF